MSFDHVGRLRFGPQQRELDGVCSREADLGLVETPLGEIEVAAAGADRAEAPRRASLQDFRALLLRQDQRLRELPLPASPETR